MNGVDTGLKLKKSLACTIGGAGDGDSIFGIFKKSKSCCSWETLDESSPSTLESIRMSEEGCRRGAGCGGDLPSSRGSTVSILKKSYACSGGGGIDLLLNNSVFDKLKKSAAC